MKEYWTKPVLKLTIAPQILIAEDKVAEYHIITDSSDFAYFVYSQSKQVSYISKYPTKTENLLFFVYKYY